MADGGAVDERLLPHRHNGCGGFVRPGGFAGGVGTFDQCGNLVDGLAQFELDKPCVGFAAVGQRQDCPSVRSRETVCMASTGSDSSSSSRKAFRSNPASSACSSSHSSMLVVPSFSACGTSMRLASPTMTCRRRYASVEWDSSRVLMIGRSKVVCRPTLAWM